MLPFNFAKKNRVILAPDLEDAEKSILIAEAAANPLALVEAQRVAGGLLPLQTVPHAEFELRLQSVYEGQHSEAESIISGLNEELDLDEIAASLAEPADLLESSDDTPIIRFINAILAEAIRDNASDIHIEPFEQRLLVRMRIDGVLKEIMEPPGGVANLIVSRIKIMAKLDIAEKRVPQDGRISLRVANRPVDVRVSTIPAGYGERIVLRLLDKQAGRLQLEQIGMDPETLKKLDQIIHLPHGIFLVTGPTGSGKTTTLYAALTRLNDSTRNVMTVEDPIEYYIDGIAQTQVSTKTGMSFARGLRAILRQDPDVVMVGEIRDLETAEIAVQASLTGHVVFSTLHTNTAIGAITRLRDMGTEPYLLASSLVGVLAQRLVRLLCPACKAEKPITEVQAQGLGVPELEGELAFAATGCRQCAGTGYQGRTAIYELVGFDDEMRELVHDGAGEHELQRHADKSGMSMTAVGLKQVHSGVTSCDELLRVTRSL
ncbi:MAG: type II secretion system ATPase GspE [Pseudomonadota bacterium]